MKLAEACAAFEQLFQIAASGETVVIEGENHRVALRPLPAKIEQSIAPAGFFTGDYSREEIAEHNLLASQAPLTLLPLSKQLFRECGRVSERRQAALLRKMCFCFRWPLV